MDPSFSKSHGFSLNLGFNQQSTTFFILMAGIYILQSSDGWAGSSSVGESLWLKLLPQCSIPLNETCYTVMITKCKVHKKFFGRPGRFGSRVMALHPDSYIFYRESLCLKLTSTVFESVEHIPEQKVRQL